MFGAQTPTSAQSTTSASNAPGGFGFGPGLSAPAAAKPGVSFNFATSSAGGGSTGLGSSFSLKLGTPAMSSASPVPPQGLAQTKAVPPSTPGAVSQPATQTGLSLGGSLSAGAVAKSSAPATGLSLGGTSSLPATATASASGAALSTLGARPAAAPATTIPGAAATATATASVGTGPKMTYKELEEQMNKWWVELGHQEKVFLEQATKVNAWDKLLIENGAKITELNSDVEKVKLDQYRLNHELDFVVAQQKELEEMLAPLEDSVTKLPALNYQQHTDSEREHTYQIAENIDAQLKRMTEDLKEVIDHLNTASSSHDSSDPMLQISKILNAHMESLQWVDQNAATLQRKTEEVARYADHTKKEHERSFRLAYS